MAVIEMNSDAKANKPRKKSLDLFARYKLAKAEYERAVYADSVAGTDCPDEILNPLSAAHDSALRAMMTHPAEDLLDLVRKIETFAEEELQDHYDVRVFVAHLAVDGRELLRWGKG